MALSLKDKLKKAKAKMSPKTTTTPKKTAKGKTETTAKKAEKRKKAIGFEVPKSNVNKLNKQYETLAGLNDQLAEQLGSFLEGKRKSAVDARSSLQEIIKLSKEMRGEITTTKGNLKPIYS